MSDTAISKEITRVFVDAVREKDIIKDIDVLKRFSALFDNHETPTVKQLKQALFNEDLP